MPQGYLNLIGFVIVVVFFVLEVLSIRKNLLKLWKDVSSKEIIFYRQLERTAKLYFLHKDILMNIDNKECYKIIARYRKKRVRSLLLQTRQNLFQSITAIYAEYEASDTDPIVKEIIKSYDLLQKHRRLYNSRVLVYNQRINIFPTRYLAIKLHLELKEYFG